MAKSKKKTTPKVENPPEAPVAPEPARSLLLREAIGIKDLRQEMYGDPSDNIGRISKLRAVFWEGEDLIESTSPWGTAMDAVLTKIGRISSAPSEEMKFHRDHYLDAINYLAIAYELGGKK